MICGCLMNKWCLLFHVCNEAHTIPVAAVAEVVRADIDATEVHVVRAEAAVRSRRPIVAEAADTEDIGTIAVARSGKEDEVVGCQCGVIGI